MPRYTTGELAKLCGVSVRTVQYYDTRKILVPSELSDGGRRLYSEDDLRRMKIICFLRETGLSLGDIGELLSSDHPGDVIAVLLEQQRETLQTEIGERQARLELLESIRRELKNTKHFSVESLGDIAYAMENKKKMKRLHGIMVLTGIPLSIFQWTTLVLWIAKGVWWPFACFVLAAVPYALWISKFYFSRAAYICPQCHAVFKPTFKEAFWARHTPNLRKLTCHSCGYNGFCVETYKKDPVDPVKNI